jgi:hypothetical protein
MEDFKMKRTFKALVLCISILCLSLSASALATIEPFSINTHFLTLDFSGNSATCSVTITGASGTTRIDNVTITLRESNGTLINEWTNLSATGARFTFNRSTTTVVRGRTYTLSFSATIHRNGVATPISGSITRTY